MWTKSAAIRSRGSATIESGPQGVSFPAKERSGHLAPGTQEGRRYPLDAAARGHRTPPSTTSSATPIRSSTASSPTALRIANCAITSRACAPACCWCRMSTRSMSSARKTSASIWRSRRSRHPASPSIAPTGARPAGAKRGRAGRRRADRQGRHSAYGFRAGLPSEERPAAREFRLQRAAGPIERHRHGEARLCRSAAADVSRQRPAGDRARHFDARGRQRRRSRRHHQARRWFRSRGLPIGIEPILVADQPYVVSDAVDDFMRSLVEALVIVIAISFLSLGLRAGAVVALSIPVVLAIVFVFMDFERYRASAGLARRPHHFARPPC